MFAVLVLGICFFAGGLRFSEQFFDPSTCVYSVRYNARSEVLLGFSCDSNQLLAPQHQRQRHAHSGRVSLRVECHERDDIERAAEGHYLDE